MKFLSIFKVQELTGLTSCEIYALMAKNEFPKCFNQGGGMMGLGKTVWVESQVKEWMGK